MTPEELKKQRYRTEICVGCGEEWNVSRKANIPESGYLCPTCRAKKQVKTTAAVVSAAGGAVMYIVCAWMAGIARGYMAFGGETVFLLIAAAGVGTLAAMCAKELKRKKDPRRQPGIRHMETVKHEAGSHEEHALILYHKL